MNPTVDKLILAPMEGVADALMRDLLTSINCFDLCITEFVRVVDQKLPAHVFKRISPELNNQGYTPAGTPVRVQLLGQDPNWLAENALTAIALGSHGVDLNFGCPAKTVNKSKGGAVLLKTPEQIYRIISTVKSALGSQTLSAKIRLGFDSTELFDEIVDAVLAGGADQLTIHARTKADGYRPPAHWEWIARVKEKVSLPIIANGDIFTVADYHQCRDISGCEDVMIGRGVIFKPDLVRNIRADQAGIEVDPMPWTQLQPLVLKFYQSMMGQVAPRYIGGRLKQWFNFLRETYPEALELFQSIKVMRDPEAIEKMLLIDNNQHH